ncbi:uncharacterized protein LOC111692338, partial [Anoplophora glabripennis]|uniref:uncharacterized protein LOC111692338 n=1 Tax=Anoplophora glabripennis TaxID=217634 RepID=UPI000C788832
MMRLAVALHERLSTTLGYLATGRDYEDLKFSTRISAQALGRIIPESLGLYSHLSHTCSDLYAKSIAGSTIVRKYKKKTSRGEWSKESMKQTVEKVLNKEMGYRKAALQYSVPQTTLERHVNAIKTKGEMNLDLPLGPITTVFSKKEENELVEYLKEMEARLFGLSTLELRSLAYQLAVKNDKYKLGPDRIYSCDETGISSVSKTKSKIISRRGRKQVGSLSSAERGQTVTVEICVSAAGSYMPPMLIFPRKRMKAQLLNNSARGTTSHCNASGWMTTDVFVSWFKSFIQFSRASKDNPVLLLLDGHATHTKNIELIDVARENGVVIICFPPHCTHRLQPLDVSFMKPHPLKDGLHV